MQVLCDLPIDVGYQYVELDSDCVCILGKSFCHLSDSFIADCTSLLLIVQFFSYVHIFGSIFRNDAIFSPGSCSFIYCVCVCFLPLSCYLKHFSIAFLKLFYMQSCVEFDDYYDKLCGLIVFHLIFISFDCSTVFCIL